MREKLDIGEVDFGGLRFVSFFDLLNGSGLLMLQGFGIAQGALIQQLLKDTTVVETELYLRDQFVRDVNRKAASF